MRNLPMRKIMTLIKKAESRYIEINLGFRSGDLYVTKKPKIMPMIRLTVRKIRAINEEEDSGTLLQSFLSFLVV